MNAATETSRPPTAKNENVKGSMNTSGKRGMAGALGLLVALGLIISACDSNQAVQSEFQTTEAQDLYSAVSSELDLSSAQQERFGEVLHQHDHGDREPGYLWIVADSLSRTLTDEQKDALINRTDSFEGFHPFLGLRGFPGGGGYYGFGGLRGAMGPEGHALADSVLNLTDEQRDAIKSIHEAFRSELKDLRDAHHDGTLSDEEFVMALIDLHQTTKDQLDGVLTEDQMAALEDFRRQHEAEFEDFRAEVRAIRDDVLGLTVEESDAFNAILEDQLNDREVLLEQFQSGALTLSELKDEVQSLRDATVEELKALLTAEQFEVVQIHAALSVRMDMKGHHGMDPNGPGGHGFMGNNNANGNGNGIGNGNGRGMGLGLGRGH